MRTRTRILHGLCLALPAAARTLAACALATGITAGTLAAATPAAAAPACGAAAEPAPVITALPWAQRWLEPQRIWPITRGRGVTVAVVDSGVDATHPQLRDGRVQTGTDLVTNTAGGNVDCDAHGTAIASIIAASTVDGVGFAGLAPQAGILPLRVAERSADRVGDQAPAATAAALRLAADAGARVINVAIVFFVDHPEIAAAVRYAQGKNAVVVAAAGNHHEDGRAVDPSAYPAAYPDVVGVGALAPDGTRAANSYVGPYLDLLAPGVDVTAATRGSGHATWTGASMATAFVSAAAALYIAANERVPARDVVRQLLATADPPAGSPNGYGHGVVNPYRALTERIDGGRPVAARAPVEAGVDPAVEARAARWRHTGTRAALVTAVAVGLAALGLLSRAIRRRGRDAGWSPTRHRPRPPVPPLDEDPERLFYTVPAPPHRQ